MNIVYFWDEVYQKVRNFLLTGAETEKLRKILSEDEPQDDIDQKACDFIWTIY